MAVFSQSCEPSKKVKKHLANRVSLAILEPMETNFTKKQIIKVAGRNFVVGIVTEKAILVHSTKEEIASLGIAARYWLPKKGMRLKGDSFELAHWVKMTLV